MGTSCRLDSKDQLQEKCTWVIIRDSLRVYLSENGLKLKVTLIKMKLMFTNQLRQSKVTILLCLQIQMSLEEHIINKSSL